MITETLNHLGYAFGKDFVVIDDGSGPRLIWHSKNKEPTESEIQAAEPAALAAKQAEAVKIAESTTARDDAKRALTALDTIIAGAPTATTAQLRAAVEQMARIEKHIIIALLGRP